MWLHSKYIDDITADDIKSLIDNEVVEDSSLDYKRDLPNKGKDREFLKDITAIANKNGGIIIYGLSEARDANNNKLGFPDKVVGIKKVLLKMKKHDFDKQLMLT